MDKIVEVVTILSKYHCYMWAEHNLIGFCPTFDMKDVTISDKDLQKLKDAGVFYDPHSKSLCLRINNG